MPPPTSVPVASTPPARRPAARPWRNVGIFLAAVAAIHLSLDAWLPLPDLGMVSEKLGYFARHKDEFDAVFVGSSRVYRQIAPAVFDRQVAAATGKPMRSFNLGVPSMFLPESLFVIDRIVAQRPARLRWMFIELDDPRPRLQEHAGLVQREVYWHGWRETALACANILGTRSIRKSDRARMLAHQAMLFGRRWTHVGRAHEWLAAWMSPAGSQRPGEEAATLVAGPEGYTPYRATLGQVKSPGKNPDADLQSFLRAVSELQTGRARAKAPGSASVVSRWLLAERARAWRAGGVEPVFVIPPVTTAEEEFLALSKRGVVKPLFAFNDPGRYPALYQVDARADTMHLNERGALLFTALLASKFADDCANAKPAATGTP